MRKKVEQTQLQSLMTHLTSLHVIKRSNSLYKSSDTDALKFSSSFLCKKNKISSLIERRHCLTVMSTENSQQK